MLKVMIDDNLEKPTPLYNYIKQTPNLILECDLLALDPSDNNIWCVLRDNLVIVQHLEFLRCVATHVTVQSCWSTLNSLLAKTHAIWNRLLTYGMLINPVGEV